jgi:hypothetical protein
MPEVILRSSYGYTPSPEAFRMNLKASTVKYCVKFGVVTAMNIKNMAFWGTSCIMVDT